MESLFQAEVRINKQRQLAEPGEIQVWFQLTFHDGKIAEQNLLQRESSPSSPQLPTSEVLNSPYELQAIYVV